MFVQRNLVIHWMPTATALCLRLNVKQMMTVLITNTAIWRLRNVTILVFRKSVVPMRSVMPQITKQFVSVLQLTPEMLKWNAVNNEKYCEAIVS